MFCLHFNRSIVVCLAWAMIPVAAASVAGQQREGPPSQPEYVIEFHTSEGCQFGPVNGSRGFFVYAMKRPDKYLPDSSGQPILSKIAVRADRAGELWNLKVFVGAGEFYDAGDRQLAAFTLRTNERADVGEGLQWGLIPFRVGVFKVSGHNAIKPRINLKTPSISVEKLEGGILPEPYHLSLKNNSEKDVLAIQYNTYKDGQFLHLEWRGLPQPLPLIKAGEDYRFEVLSQDRTCADPEGYRPVQSDRIEIASVVFVDGSYEGDSGLAALIWGRSLGNKKNLEGVVATLNNLNGSDESNPELLAYQLRVLSEGMDEVAEPSLAQTIRKGLPAEGDYSMSALTNFIRSGQHEIKTNLASDAWQLQRLIKTQNREAVKKWSAQTIAKYKQWLALAEAVSPH